MLVKNDRISFCSILLAAYFAITPIHQTLLLSSGSTVNKYLAVLIMIFCILKSRILDKVFLLNIIPIWFFAALSVLWSESKSESLKAVISIVSYSAFALLVCSNKWNEREKRLIVFAFVVASAVFSVYLISSQSTMRRSTFLGISGKNADQNVLAANIGMAALILLRLFYKAKRQIQGLVALALIGVILLGVFSTGSRGAVVSTVISSLFIISNSIEFPKCRTVFLIFLLSVFLIYIGVGNTNLGEIVMMRIFTSDSYFNAGTSRMAVWSRHFEILLHRQWGFVWGFGFGGENAAYRSFYQQTWSVATHQDILNMVCYGGFILLSLFGNFICFVWNKSRKEKNILGTACLLFTLVMGLTVDYYTTYGWWNAVIVAYIGIDSVFAS